MDDAEQRARERTEDRRWPAAALARELAVALRRHHHELARLLGLREVELACLQLVDRPRGLAMGALTGSPTTSCGPWRGGSP